MNHNSARHLCQDSSLGPDSLVRAHHLLSVSDAHIWDNHSYYFLNKNHCRESSFSFSQKPKRSRLQNRRSKTCTCTWDRDVHEKPSPGPDGKFCTEHLFLHGQIHHRHHQCASMHCSICCSLPCNFRIWTPLASSSLPVPPHKDTPTELHRMGVGKDRPRSLYHEVLTNPGCVTNLIIGSSTSADPEESTA